MTDRQYHSDHCLTSAVSLWFIRLMRIKTDNKAFVCLFGVLRRFQHCTGHITTGSWKGRGNQYI